MSHFVEANRGQPFLLPPDLRAGGPEDDPAHFVLEAVQRVGVHHFRVNQRGGGSPHYPPRLKLARELKLLTVATASADARRHDRPSTPSLPMPTTSSPTGCSPG
jgi:hypothetical protein